MEPPACASEYPVTLANGYVYKKLVEQGDGRCPPDKAKVIVDFTVSSLDNVLIDSVQDLTLVLGTGSIFRGLDAAVASMIDGESSEFLLHPRYSWTDKGFEISTRVHPRLRNTLLNAAKTENAIYDKQWLKLTVRLHSFAHESKVTEDGRILKRLIKTGELARARPNDGAKCRCLWSWRVKGEPEWRYQSINQNEPSLITIYEDPHTLWGLEESLKNMHPGEHCQLTVYSEYGFTPYEIKHQNLSFEPETILEIEVQLLDYEKGVETWQLSDVEKLEYMMKWKDSANQSFQCQDPRRAIRKYLKVLQVFQYDAHLTEEQRKTSDSLKVAVHSNMALCKSQLGQELTVDIFKHCNEALRLNPRHVKSLYRRAQAHIAIGEDQHAAKDLQQCIKLEPNHKQAQGELYAVNGRLDAIREKERAAYKNAF